MKVSYTQLQIYFEDALPDAQTLSDALSFHFAEVESIEDVAGDKILDIKVLPDRAAYAKSYEGIAMEVSAILGLKRKNSMIPTYEYVRTVEVNPADINRTLGFEIPTEKIISILKSMDLQVTESSSELSVAIPSNRPDLQDWRDIPEEVGRLYGYDKIPTKIPAVLVNTEVDAWFYYTEKIKNILVEKGFSEVYGYSLTSKGVFQIEKSVAQDKNYLRANLTDGIVKSLEFNARNADLLGLDSINIFEIGKVFCEEGEHTALTIGIKSVKKIKGAAKDKDQIKVVRDELLKELGADATILCTVDDTGGIISIKGKTVGITNRVEGIMELNLDEVIKHLSVPTSYADLNLTKASHIEYKKLSVYPSMVRDIAVFVPESVTAEEVWETIKKGITGTGGLDLLARHSLFDTFKKDAKVSYAYRMIFQSMDRTLTDEEMLKVMEKVSGGIKEKGWEVR